jgi:omega-6 fatty acid desaturase (delta-12 desaturase)
MMTVEEYQDASRWDRLKYWVFRHPLFMFTFGPVLTFGLLNRFPGPHSRRREKLSVLWCNLALFGIWTVLGLTIGLEAYLLMQLPVLAIAGAAGIWLFYVQHQYRDSYWARHGEYDATAAALSGSSFYRLPRILQWFSGNIGFHHIHHLNSRIPNYHLEPCHLELPDLPGVRRLGLRASLESLKLRLWDEKRGRLVGFHEVG